MNSCSRRQLFPTELEKCVRRRGGNTVYSGYSTEEGERIQGDGRQERYRQQTYSAHPGVLHSVSDALLSKVHGQSKCGGRLAYGNCNDSSEHSSEGRKKRAFLLSRCHKDASRFSTLI